MEPQQAAAAAAAAACCCLIQSSQRRSEACRNRVVLSLLRLSAFKPIDRSWMVARVSLRRVLLAMAGLRSVRWRAERATKQRENHGSDGCHKTSDLAPPRAGPSQRALGCGLSGRRAQLVGRKVERDAAEPGQRGWDRERRSRSESPSDGKAGRRGATAFERRAGEQNAAPPCASFCSNFTGTSMSYAV